MYGFSFISNTQLKLNTIYLVLAQTVDTCSVVLAMTVVLNFT